MHLPTPLLCFAAIAAALPLTAQQRITETVYPCDIPVQKGEEVWQSCRIIDGVNGKPVAGAEMLLVEESPTPVAGRFWSTRVAISDADGFVRLRSDDLKMSPKERREERERARRMRQPEKRDPTQWLLVRAPGYGASAVLGVVPSLVWPLSPALDMPIELRNWQDLPVANAGIGFCLGSGQTPDIVNVTTDAAGRAVLRGIDPNNPTTDIYPESPELGIADYGHFDWAPGDLPVVVRAPQAIPLRGKVLDADGNPVAGAYVGIKEVQRGPWTVTGADGTFLLAGTTAENDLFVVVDKHEVQFERPDGEPPLTLRLPVPVEGHTQVVELPTLPDGPLGTVKLHLQDQHGQAIEDLEITTEGPLPRHRRVEEQVQDGVCEFQRLPGSYDVVCRSEGYERRIGRIEVTAGKVIEPKLQPVPLTTIAVRAEDMPELGSIYLRTGSRTREITELFADDGTASVPVPNHEPFCFVVGSETGVRVVRTTLAEAQRANPLVLKAFAPTHVSGQIVGSDGKATAAAVSLVSRWDCLRADGGFDLRKLDLVQSDDGRFDLPGKQVGLAFVAVVPFDLKLRPRLLPVSLPYRGVDSRVDVGKVALLDHALVRVLGADGKPLGGVMAGLTRVGWHDLRERGPMFPTDDDGGFLGPDPRAGDAIVVPAAAWDLEQEPGDDQQLVVDVPFRTVLAGSGPWTIQVPGGELALDIHDKEGKPIKARVFVGDRSIAVEGPTLLRQLAPGKVELVITAIDRKTMFATAEVPANGRGTFAVELPE